MLTLSLYRHAKSDWPTGPDAVTDHDRTLAKRGWKAANRMGRYLRDENLIPDLVVCSTALRTRQTHERTFAEMGKPPPTVFTRTLFHASEFELLDTVKSCANIAAQEGLAADAVHHLMLIAHNPGLQDFACDLPGTGDRESRTEINIKFPTAALAVITFDTSDWSTIKMGDGTLQRFVKPRLLDD